ncbi:amidase [Kribbella sp. NPDC051587]|uniref:amidase n=1 Tax=Kribbella sp. NPDC051587 TaxID=3364119 RepID=UPI0037A7176C
MSELWRLRAGELAARIAGKEVTSVEVVEAHLERIAEVDPQVNAVVRVLADEARAAAAAADRQIADGAVLGPLHGVPFTVKENLDVAGLPTTWGVPALAEAIPPENAPAVDRMLDAGAILLGRTNLSDMALRVDTGSTLHGRTYNPWNAARTAGGSSGGEGVALATGMSPLGLGTDIGGSLRSPASACGIASIRPSAGRVPDAGYVPSADRLLAVQLFNVVGPMARRVADVRLALGVLSGAHPRDPLSLDVPAELPLDGPIRVAVSASPLGDKVDPAVAAAVGKAADALSDAGYDVVDVVPPRYEEAEEVWLRLLLGDYASVLDHLLPIMGAPGVAFLNALSDSVAPVSGLAEMSGLLAVRDGIARDWSLFLQDHPLILTPTWSQLPFEIGLDTETAAGAVATRQLIKPMMPANLLGLPSACVPATRDNETGLPVGVLITGRRFRDDLCLDAAEAIESRLPLSTPIDPVGTPSGHSPNES